MSRQNTDFPEDLSGTCVAFVFFFQFCEWEQICHYRLCVWTLFVSEGNYILLRFSHFDIELETFCDYDSLSVYSKDNRLVGELLSFYSIK